MMLFVNGIVEIVIELFNGEKDSFFFVGSILDTAYGRENLKCKCFEFETFSILASLL